MRCFLNLKTARGLIRNRRQSSLFISPFVRLKFHYATISGNSRREIGPLEEYSERIVMGTLRDDAAQLDMIKKTS